MTSPEQKSLQRWVFRHKGNILIRLNGEKIYSGPEVDMTDEQRKICSSLEAEIDESNRLDQEQKGRNE